MLSHPILNRHRLIDLLPDYPIVGVEVGVDCGVFSAYLLKHGNFKTLWSIDSWELGVYHQDYLHSREAAYAKAVTCLSQFGAISKIIKDTSEAASKQFEDGSLDFIFIDAGHDYNNIALDIKSWWPKLTTTGLFAGHDYCHKYPGVVRAVNEHAAAVNLPIGFSAEHDYPSWYMSRQWF